MLKKEVEQYVKNAKNAFLDAMEHLDQAEGQVDEPERLKVLGLATDRMHNTIHGWDATSTAAAGFKDTKLHEKMKEVSRNMATYQNRHAAILLGRPYDPDNFCKSIPEEQPKAEEPKPEPEKKSCMASLVKKLRTHKVKIGITVAAIAVVGVGGYCLLKD